MCARLKLGREHGFALEDPNASVSEFELRQGDAREVLRTLPEESIHCSITSPPYWGLRDYGVSDYNGKWQQAIPQANGRRILANVRARRRSGEAHDYPFPPPRTLAWRPTCTHGHHPVPCVVLDPSAAAVRAA